MTAKQRLACKQRPLTREFLYFRLSKPGAPLIFSFPNYLKIEDIVFKTNSPASQRLIDALMRFRTLQHHHRPVGGLRQSEFWLLAKLNKAGLDDKRGVRVSDLAGMLDVATPTATQMVKRLEGMGYLIRRRSTKDKRIVHVVPTKKGSDFMENAHRQFVSRFEAVVEYLGEQDSNTLAQLLNRVTEFLKNHTQNEMR